MHRLAILQSLSLTCAVLVAADAFQCLFDARDTTALMEWLETSGTTRRLIQPQRTNQQGLLAAALAVRNAEDIKGVLTARTFKNRTTWRGAGFQLLEVPATQANAALLAWSISNEFSQRQGQVAVITPDARNRIVRTALDTVQTRQYVRANGATFGPFRFSWDRNDTEEADALLADVDLPDTASSLEFRALLRPMLQQASIAHACSRMDRLRRLSGKINFTRQEFVELVRESVRNRSRMGVGQVRGHAAMTVQRAKNLRISAIVTGHFG